MNIHRLIAPFLAALVLTWPSVSYACARPMFDFAPGSHRLGAESADMLDFAVEEYRASPGSRLAVVARSKISPTSSSQRLAQLRGQAVKGALIRRGIPSKLIKIYVIRARYAGETDLVDIDFAAPTASCG